MYIKQVIIEGFKSYKSRTVLGPFHQKLNVIVGANGSGKTNILYAIQFVITDQFSYLSKDVRRNLIFSGSGVRCQCASVNIILNNFDNRLPVETEEVSLCRKIGLTFDKLYVNGKQTTHKEMKNLLIAAGFSTCNPFYLVKQGKVCELAAASDAHRLTVLLEAFGDRDSEEIIRKSKAYLNENELKMKIVKSFLNNLHEKLALLEEDRDNLKAFNELQRMKTTMEACLFQRELVEIEKDLHAVEKSYLETLRSQNEYRESQQHVFEEIKETKVLLEKTEKQLKDLKNKRDKFKKDKQLLQAEIDEIVLEISMLKDLEIKNADDQKVYLQNKIEELNIQMIKNEEALKLMKSEHDKMEIKEKEITRRIEEMKQNREELFDKLGRCNQFKSKEERDAWLKNELRSIQKTSSDIRLKKDNLEKEVLEASEKIKKLENEIKDLKNTINQKLLQVEELGKFLNDLLKIRTEGQSMLRELFQEEALCEQKSSSLKDDLPKSRRTLYSVAHRNSIAGLEGLQKVLESLQESGDTTVEGYYGMVIDNLDCDESLFKAVEVTAGKKLFYHIVEDEKICRKLTKEFNRKKFHGEVNFFLLNQLRVKRYYYPASNDIIPLIRKLEFDEMFTKTMHYIFGRTLICRNIDTALHFADTKSFDCVTLDGDQVMNSGKMFGGYHVGKESQISVYKNFTSLQKELREIEKNTKILQEKLNHSRSEMVKSSNKKQRSEQRVGSIKSEIEQLNLTRRLLNEELNVWKDFKSKKEESVSKYQTDLELWDSHLANLKQELNQDMTSQLSESEQRNLHKLNDDIKRLEEDYKNILKKKQKLNYSEEFSKKNNYIKLHESLVQELNELNKDEPMKTLETVSLTLDTLKKKKDSIQRQLKDIERAWVEAVKVQKLTREKYITQSAEVANVEQQIEEYRKDTDVIINKKSSLMDKIKEHKDKMLKLGPLSLKEQLKCENMRSKDIRTQLLEANRKMRQFQSFNMQAEFMYDEIHGGKETEEKQVILLLKDKKRLIKLINIKEKGKNDKILCVLRETAHKFRNIFKKLVPKGHAALVIKNSTDESLPLHNIRELDTMKGVGVRACFDIDTSEFQNFREFSEGQKALIALSFIISLQKFCQTPFYLFDEVDSMLDTEYKPKLAQMLTEFSKEAQYIIIAHSATAVKQANRIFGVTFGNEVSHVNVLNKETALQMVNP